MDANASGQLKDISRGFRGVTAAKHAVFVKKDSKDKFGRSCNFFTFSPSKTIQPSVYAY